MCKDKEIEVIDLDECEEDLEEEENEWTPDGINKITGEYDAEHDAWYPDFKALADTEKEIINGEIFRRKNG